MAKKAIVRYVSDEEMQHVRERKRVIVDKELDRLASENEGTITVDLVLESARASGSPLNRYFDWDDGRAAEKWRRVQALQLIMASKMVAQLIKQNDEPVAAIAEHAEVRRLVNAFQGEGFRMRPEILSDQEQRQAIIKRHIERLRSWLRATIDLAELEPIRTLVAKVLPKV